MIGNGMIEHRTIEQGMTLGEIVLRYPRCARVFDAARLDFCCGGRETLGAASARKGLDVAALVSSLDAAVREGQAAGDEDLAGVSPLALVSHIMERYHRPLRAHLSVVGTRAEKVARMHGRDHAEMATLGAEIAALVHELTLHMDREEQVLFPALLVPSSANAGMVRGELASMRAEHDEVARRLSRIRELAGNFRPPDWGCGTVRVLFSELAELEASLHRHIHLENHGLASPPTD